MNIIYTLKNITNELKGIKPVFYIGSKTNCKIKSNTIIDKNKREYWSSSKYVRESIKKGDEWVLVCFTEVDIDCCICEIEAVEQERFDAKNNDLFYNKSHANKKFNSQLDGVGESISKSKVGKTLPHMYKREHWGRLHTKSAIKKSSESRVGNQKVIDAAIKRNAEWSKDPEYRKRRSEISRNANLGRKLGEHELWLRKHDDRYKPNRKLSNSQVWDIRFGKHKDLSLNELCCIYDYVTKPTLCRVKKFKVFKDIKKGWKDET